MIENALTKTEYWDKSISLKKYPSRVFCRMDYELLKLIHPYLESKKGKRLVEFGCGCSYVLPYFAKEYGYKVSGIDYSVDRLNVAVDNLEGIYGTDLVWGDFKDIPIDWYKKFDVVYSGGVIEHFKYQSSTLKLFAQCMKSDGLMITTVPHLKGFWGDLGVKLNREADSGYIKMNLDDLIRVHEQAGLKVIYAKYFRWLDFSIANYSSLPKSLRTLVCCGVIGLDVLLNLLFRVYHPQFSSKYYSDMLVVSIK